MGYFRLLRGAGFPGGLVLGSGWAWLPVNSLGFGVLFAGFLCWCDVVGYCLLDFGVWFWVACLSGLV